MGEQCKSINWDEWLSKRESSLKMVGYQKHKTTDFEESFSYWKDFGGYQIGILFYDFRQYNALYSQNIKIIYRVMRTDCDGRFDMLVSKDVNLLEFELMAKAWYNAMLPYSK